LQGKRQKMHRQAISILVLCLLSASLYAEDSLPIIEVKADRTMIYPQRMDLNGEETLQDILQMMPDLMINGYDDVIDEYNLRIDNSPINGDTRLILSQMKAKDIATIQVCTNTGVAKGTIGIGKVLDINMAMPDTVKGLAEAQGDFRQRDRWEWYGERAVRQRAHRLVCQCIVPLPKRSQGVCIVTHDEPV